MSDTITYKAIRDRIQSAAHELTPELPKFPNPIDFSDPEDCKTHCLEAWESFIAECETAQDESYDKAFDEVSNWNWSIYTYKGFQVYDALNGQEQREAEELFEDMAGYETVADQRMGPYEMGCHMAMYWLAQQVSESIQEACEELLELANNQLENMEA